MFPFSLRTPVLRILLILGFFSIAVFSLMDTQDCLHCKDRCDNTTGYCNGTCENGYYGNDCNSTCPQNCHSMCTRETGDCTFCKDTFYGSNCSLHCPSKCQNNHCTITGQCFGCEKGYYSGKCDHKCPINCGIACGQDTGTCDFGCNEGHWGSNCDRNCSDRCKDQCQQSSGRCWSCKPGYGGFNCEIDCIKNCDSCSKNDSCYQCLPGWYGESCDKKCPVNCENSVCSIFDGSCSCAEGWYGETCDKKCIENCGSCIDNSTCIECSLGYSGRFCDKSCPGNCTSCSRDGEKCTGCKPNSYGSDMKCMCDLGQCLKKDGECVQCKEPGWYTRFGGCCKCSEYCKGGYSNCDNTTGLCLEGCEPGYYGDKCLEKCSKYCAGNGTICNSTTGECPSGCENDWYFSTCKYGCSLETPHCGKCFSFKDTYNNFEVGGCSMCSEGYYRSFHVSTCKPCDTCLNNRCNGTNGLCLKGCKNGWYMNPYNPGICDRKCNIGCVDQACDNENGTCIHGCNPGYTGRQCNFICGEKCLNRTCHQFSQTCLKCVTGQWGDYCYIGCDSCANGNCNRSTGTCDDGCKPGYYGPMCMSYCTNCMSQDCDQVGSCQSGCIPRFYGQQCNASCPDKCQICHPVFGHCLDKSKVCNVTMHCNFTDTKCQQGKYGFNCEHNCSLGCKNDSSSGYLCEKYTGICIHGCSYGKYGDTCKQTCGKCSLNSNDQNACDPKTGRCGSCLKTYYGDRCLLSCNRTCLGSDCRSNGFCSNGCEDGWNGVYCEVQRAKNPEKLRDLSTGAISGISIGSVVLVLVIIVGIVFICRKRNGDGNQFKMTDY